MNDIQDYLEWAKSKSGVESARTDILVTRLTFPEKLIELLNLRNVTGALQKNVFIRASGKTHEFIRGMKGSLDIYMLL